MEWSGAGCRSATMARLLGVASLAVAAAGCEALGTYWHETAGISPTKLVPLYLQEKRYVEDREIAARVRGALAADPALAGVQVVDVFHRRVTLSGPVSPEQAARALAVAASMWDVESAEFR